MRHRLNRGGDRALNRAIHTIGVCVKDALMWSTGARMKNTPMLDGLGDSDRLPNPDAYDLRPPLLIEGYPGRTSKIGAEEPFVQTLAGLTAPAWALSELFGKEQGGASPTTCTVRSG